MARRPAPAFAVNCSILFADLPLCERPAAAKAAGFDAVEFWWPFEQPAPTASELEAFVSALSDAEVTLASLGFDHGDLSAGDRGLFASASRRDRLRQNIDAVVDLGLRSGCRTFVALFGRPDDGEDSAVAIALENFTFATRAVATIDGTVALEPMSATPGYPIRTLEHAAAFAAEVRERSGTNAMGVLADLYHLGENETDVAAALRAHARSIRYAQVADRPGRGVPGSGTEPLRELLELIRDLGYDGTIGLEFAPSEAGSRADLARFQRWLDAPS